jgi:hypothetical protein
MSEDIPLNSSGYRYKQDLQPNLADHRWLKLETRWDTPYFSGWSFGTYPSLIILYFVVN